MFQQADVPAFSVIGTFLFPLGEAISLDSSPVLLFSLNLKPTVASGAVSNMDTQFTIPSPPQSCDKITWHVRGLKLNDLNMYTQA